VPITVQVRNLTGSEIKAAHREVIQREVVKYLYNGYDDRLLVVTHKWRGDHDHSEAVPVSAGYSLLETIEERRDKDYANQVWWVCQLSQSLKVVTVKKTLSVLDLEPERAVERLSSRVLGSMNMLPPSPHIGDMLINEEAPLTKLLKEEESE
jgi:hypothetical protein